jgi:hypothetical protein
LVALVAGSAVGGTAHARDLSETNVSATSVGAQFWHSPVLADVGGPTEDVDILLGQRLRWTLAQNDRLAIRARADARFTLGPGDEAFFERNRVTQLGVSVLTPGFTLDIGRHRVVRGGPRLVDGVQFIAHPSKVFDIGVWAGMAPDLFTTEFRTERFGGGPVIAWTASRVQASLTGDFLVGKGNIDRAAMLAQGRLNLSRTIEVSGRIDTDFAADLHLSDANVWARWTPVEAFRVDAFYDAFSSYRYQETENLDPDIQRFALRMRQNDGRLGKILQDCLEPKVAHAVGSNVFLSPRSDGVAPHIGVRGRYRFPNEEDEAVLYDPANPDAFANAQPQCLFDDINQFVRVNPQLGLKGLPIAGRMDVTLDANYYQIDGQDQADAGVIVFWEPSDDGVFALDFSYRAIFNQYDPQNNPRGYEGLGHYGDIFIDLVIPSADVMVGTGLNLVSEPGPYAEDMGVGAFGRVTKYFRGARKPTSASDP